MLAGLRFVAVDGTVRGALITDLAATVLAMPISLIPLINAERFADSPSTLGLLLAAMAVGGVLASVFSGSFTRSRRPGLVMVAAAMAWGLSLAAFGIARSPSAVLACLVVAGAADTVTVVCRSTLIRLHTPESFLGRVVAVEQIVSQAGPAAGNLRAGLVASLTTPATALISGGLLCLATVLLVALTSREFRRR